MDASETTPFPAPGAGEGLLRLLVEHSPAAIAVLDTGMNYLLVSTRWLKDYGLDEQAVIGRNHYDLFPDIPERWRELHRRCLAGATESCEEDPFPRADGTLDWVKWEIRPWHGTDGTLGGLVIFSEVITRQVNLRDALRDSHELNDLFMRYSPVLTYIKDVSPTEGRVLQASDNFQEIFGLSGEAMVGKSMHELFPEDVAARVIAEDWNVVTQGNVKEFEIFRNGRHLRATKFPITQHGRTLLGGFTVDVTDAREAEDRLRASEERLRLALEGSRDGIWDWDLVTGTIFRSQAWFTMLGYAQEDDLGELEDIRTIIHPDDRDRVTETSRKAIAEGIAYQVEARLRCADGSWRWILSRGKVSARDTQGKAVRLSGINSDIHERKLAELARQESELRLEGAQRIALAELNERKLLEVELREREAEFRTLFERAPLGMAIVDSTSGRFLSANPRMGSILGRDPRDLLDHTFQDFTHPDHLETDLASVRALAARELSEISKEKRYLHPSGKEVWVRLKMVRLPTAPDQPPRHLSIVEDITEHKQGAENMAALQAQLNQVQKMESLGTLAGGVAHDINNVLGAILGLASAHIGSQPYGSPLHQALDTICKATERGGKVVKSLLNFARQSPAENRELELNALLREQVNLLERTTLAKVRLRLDLDEDVPPILGDAGALAHAFMNLCVNAVDAMAEDGLLTLRTRRVDHDWIEVVVEDNGTGMPREVMAKALDPFFTTKGIGKGTGLGLSMVFSTVKAHRGQMSIESEPGQGTRVRLRFPACVKAFRSAAEAASEATHVPLGALNVLLVDDDDLIQSSVQMLLAVLGYSAVTPARSGEEALGLLEAGFEPDLVILDLNMPGLGGAGTLPRLRSLRPGLPVLLSTGRADQTALNLASGLPGVTLLAKPFGLRELQKHLEDLGLGSRNRPL